MPQLSDLTGTWRGDDGSVTYIRQAELEDSIQIFWASTGVFSYPFSNIFMGYRVGSSIIGQWVDVPQNSDNYIGSMSLEVVDAYTIRQVANTLNYGTRLWTKIRSGFPPICTAEPSMDDEVTPKVFPCQ